MALVHDSSIMAAAETVQRAVREFEEAVRHCQAECKHESIAESPYQHMEFFSSRPPLRVCLVCGVTEEGWGSGYKVLKFPKGSIAGPASITRDNLAKVQVGAFYHQDGDVSFVRNY